MVYLPFGLHTQHSCVETKQTFIKIVKSLNSISGYEDKEEVALSIDSAFIG